MNVLSFNSSRNFTLIFGILFFLGTILRFYYTPFQLPLTLDALDNFTYASSINFYQNLPTEWSPPNIGWPLTLSFFFSIISLDNTLEYMQLQRLISIILSSLIFIPVYFLCRRFFNEKISIIGASLFLFEPRIILNSTLGITEPIFILLGITSLLFFLNSNTKWIYLSFIIVSFATLIRAEGFFIFLTLTSLFFLRFHILKDIFKIYIPSLTIYFLILIPSILYKIDTHGNDAMFQRIAIGSNQILVNTQENGFEQIFNGIQLFIEYLGWIMIPFFIILLPIGFFILLKNRSKDNVFIFFYLFFSSIPIFYGYFMQAQDTRYFYILYPIFSLISCFTIKYFFSKQNKKSFFIFFFMMSIIIASIGFSEYKKIDYEKEQEFNKISLLISKDISGINYHPSFASYIRASEVPYVWPFLFYDKTYKIEIISYSNYETLDSFVGNNQNLTHLIVDDNPNLKPFLREIYENESKIDYLEKTFDSKEFGYAHNVKLFKINFEKFEKQMN